MITFVFIIMFLSGISFITSVLLMSPKGGLGFGIGGMSTSNEYSSKKSVESTLKKFAFWSIIIFGISAMIYPYLAKNQLSTNNVNQQATKNATLTPNINVGTGIQSKQQDTNSNIKLEGINSKGQNIKINTKGNKNNISTGNTEK